MIYLAALVKSDKYRHIESLASPSLLRVNREVHAEALPIYYGGHTIHLELPESEHQWQRFLSMLHLAASQGILSFINCIDFSSYVKVQPMMDEPPRKGVVLVTLYSETPKHVIRMHQRDRSDRVDEHRVGDDDTDWSDHETVKTIFRRTLKITLGGRSKKQREHRRRPVDRLGETLALLAPWCTRANKYIDVFFFFPDFEDSDY